MIERITPLSDDFHHVAQSLLPWCVTGQLDAEDRARVEAHLAVCAQCQSDLKAERGLREAIAEQPAGAELGWARLRARIEGEAATRTALARPVQRRARDWREVVPWTGWALAASLLAVWLVAAPTLAPPAAPARFHTLAARPAAPASANVLIMFAPETPERELRAALEAGDARLVDGPTQAGAYVLGVPAAERSSALATLRRRPGVVLAEPLGAGDAR